MKAIAMRQGIEHKRFCVRLCVWLGVISAYRCKVMGRRGMVLFLQKDRERLLTHCLT